MSIPDIERSITTRLASTSVNGLSTSAIDGFAGDHADVMCGNSTIPQVIVPLTHLHPTNHQVKQKKDRSRHWGTSTNSILSSASNAVSRGLLTGVEPSPLEPRFTDKIRRQQPVRALKILPSIEGNDIQPDSPPPRGQVLDRNWLPIKDAKSDWLSFNSSSQSTDGTRLSPSPADAERRAESRSKRKFSSSPSSILLESPSDERHRKSIKRESLKLRNSRQKRGYYDGPVAPPPVAFDVDPQAQKLEEMGFVEVRKSDVAYSKWQRAESQMEKEIAALREAYEDSLQQEQGRLFTHHEDCQEKILRAVESHETPGEIKTDIKQFKKTKNPITELRLEALAPNLGRYGADNKDTQRSGSADLKISKAFPLLRRREVKLPLRDCNDLNQYFADSGLKAPKFERFPDSRADFLACAEHVVRCPNHHPALIRNCQIILGTERFKGPERIHPQKGNGNNDSESESPIDCAEKFLFSDLPVESPAATENGSRANHSRIQPGFKKLTDKSEARFRAQSSIGPSFYGGSPRRQGFVSATHTLARPTAESSKIVLPANENPAAYISSRANGETQGRTPIAKNLLQRQGNHADQQPQNVTTSANSSERQCVSNRKTTKIKSRSRLASKVSSGSDYPRLNAEFMEMPTDTSKGRTERKAESTKTHTSTDKHVSRDFGGKNLRQQNTPPPSSPLESGNRRVDPQGRSKSSITSTMSRSSVPSNTTLSNHQQQINNGRRPTNDRTVIHDVFDPNEELDRNLLQSRSFPSSTSRQVSAAKEERTRLRNRQLSMPVTLADHARTVHKDATVARTPTPSSRDRALQELSVNMDLSQRALRQIGQVFEGVVNDQLPRHLTNLIAQENRIPHAAQAPVQQAVLSPKSRRKQKRAANRQQHPRLSSEVPEDDRSSDAELVNLGREKDGYTRHCGAPYAFGVKGRLKAPYAHLLDMRQEDGSPVWTAQQQWRLLN